MVTAIMGLLEVGDIEGGDAVLIYATN